LYRAEDADPPAIVCVVGKTELRYHLSAIEDLHAMQKPAAEGTVAWGRSAKNPVKGWYGLKKGLRGRFGMYRPPLLEALGLAEVTHEAKNNKMRREAAVARFKKDLRSFDVYEAWSVNIWCRSGTSAQGSAG